MSLPIYRFTDLPIYKINDLGRYSILLITILLTNFADNYSRMATEKGKKRKFRREIIEWGVIISVGAFLYLTGLHTQVIGTVQGLVLKTGIMKPSITETDAEDATYEFKLISGSGEVLNGDDLKGKTVFINLWATWCPPCIAEMPDINNLYNELASDDIVFLMVSLDDDFEKAKRFIAKKEFEFKIYQFHSNIPEVYFSKVIPTTFVLSPDGKIVVRKQGMAKYTGKSFKNFLKSL